MLFKKKKLKKAQPQDIEGDGDDWSLNPDGKGHHKFESDWVDKREKIEKAKKRDRAMKRLRNALINGTAGAALGGYVHGGKSGYQGARIGAAAGALIGALQNPKKRSATADSIAAGGDFNFSAAFKGFRKEHQNPNGGLNAKGRAAYNRATGANLKAPQPKGGKRRDSFCARMKGMKEKLTSNKTANDPNSRINKSLRAWACEMKGRVNEFAKVGDPFILIGDNGLPFIRQGPSGKDGSAVSKLRRSKMAQSLKSAKRHPNNERRKLKVKAMIEARRLSKSADSARAPRSPKDGYNAAKRDAMKAAIDLREAVLAKGKEIKSALLAKAKSPLARKIAIGGTLAGVVGYGARRAMRKKRVGDENVTTANLSQMLNDDSMKEFGVVGALLPSLVGNMAVSGTVDKLRKKTYQAVRTRIKSKKFGPKVARAASLAPEAVIGGGAGLAAESAWNKIKPKKRDTEMSSPQRLVELAKNIKEIDRPRRSAIKDAALIGGTSAAVGGGAGALIGGTDAKGLVKKIKRIDPFREFRPGFSGTDPDAERGLKLRKIEDYATGDSWKHEVKSNRPAFSGGKFTKGEAAARASLNKAYARRKRMIKGGIAGAVIAGATGAALAKKKKPIANKSESREDEMRKRMAGIGSLAGLSVTAPSSIKSGNPTRAILGSLIAGKLGGSVGAAIGSRMRSKKKDKKKELTSKMNDLKQFMSAEAAQVSRPERKKRGGLQKLRDATLIAAGLATAGGAVHVARKVGKTAEKVGKAVVSHGTKDKAASVSDVLRDARSAASSIRDTAREAAKATKVYGGVAGGILDATEGGKALLSPRKLIRNARRGYRQGKYEARAAAKEAVRRQSLGINKKRADIVAKRRAARGWVALNRLMKLVEFVHYPSYHPRFRDDDYEQPKAEVQPLTDEQRQEIANDRKTLKKIGVGALATGGLMAYAGSNNPALRAGRYWASKKLAKTMPGLAKKIRPVSSNKQVTGASKGMMKPKTAQSAKPKRSRKPRGGKKKLMAKLRLHLFGGRQDKGQLREEGSLRMADPFKAITGQSKAGYVRKDSNMNPMREYTDKDGSYGPKGTKYVLKPGDPLYKHGKTIVDAIDHRDLVGHGQVVKGVYNKVKKATGVVERVGRLGKDAVDTIRGKPRERDSYGRKRKREWEKGWFKKAATAGVLTAGTLAYLKDPKRAKKAGEMAGKAGRFINNVIPDFKAFSKVEFDETAPSWDVRDQRGNSARVYAPGSRARERREKRWHEKLENERKLWAAGLLVAAGAGAKIAKLPRFNKAKAKIKPKPKRRKGTDSLLKQAQKAGGVSPTPRTFPPDLNR